MKKTLTLFALAALFATQGFAIYIVVLKDGTKYKTQAKWTIVNGKALMKLENGQTLALDPNLIDVAKSEETTRLGLGSVDLINTNQQGGNSGGGSPQQSTLGSSVHLRKLPPAGTPPANNAAAPPPPPPVAPASGSSIGPDVIDKFERSYENVGVFEHHITSTGPHNLRCEITADNEEKVFNAISATSFLIVHNAGVPGVEIEMVELLMKTTPGGSSGRFQMTRDDATKLDNKTLAIPEYYVRRVIF